jgi:hypothetical protein
MKQRLVSYLLIILLGFSISLIADGLLVALKVTIFLAAIATLWEGLLGYLKKRRRDRQ